MQEFFEMSKRVLSVHNTGILKCIRLNNGYCTVSNSKMAYTTFLGEFDHLDAIVDAKKFIAACAGAGYAPEIKQTDSFLTFKRGSFKARIALVNDIYPEIKVKGDSMPLPREVFNKIRKLVPFVSTDVSRPWATSMLFDTRHAYASNNVVAARVPLVTPRKFALPTFTLTEILRATADVTRVSMTDMAVRFDFNNNVSLQSPLINADWPDVKAVISAAATDAPAVPTDMRACVETLLPLCENMQLPKIILSEEGISTADGSSFASNNTHAFPRGSFHATPLLEVLKVATSINFAGYPKPCYFTGPDIEGVLMGLR